MTEKEFEEIRRRIKKRAELDHMYLIEQMETYNKTGIPPIYPPDDFTNKVMDCIAYGKQLKSL